MKVERRFLNLAERVVMSAAAIIISHSIPVNGVSVEAAGQSVSAHTVNSNLDIRFYLLGSFPNRPENSLDELPLEDAKVNLGDQVTPGVRIYVVNKEESYPAELIVETTVQTTGVEAKACTLPPNIDCTLKAPLNVSVAVSTAALKLPGVGLIEENSLTRVEAIRGVGKEHVTIRVKDKANNNVLFEQPVDVTVLPAYTQFLPFLQVSR